jgi:hypothetical protein
MPPIVYVMHRVIHDKISTDGQFLYTGEKITNWKSHSNLLAVIRQMHQEF